VLHLVTKENRSLYARELDDLFRVRKFVFVDELGWQLTVTPDGREIDQYDDDEAMYGIGFDCNGRVTMAGRYRPTLRNSMLGDIFPHAVAEGLDGLPGPATWEFSRGFCLETGGKRHNQQRRAMLMLTPLEIAHASGVTSYIAFSEVRLLPLFMQMGWRITLLGDPTDFGQGTGIAFEIDASDVAIAKIRRDFDLPEQGYIKLMPDPNDQRSIHERAADLALQSSLTASLQPQEGDIREVAQNAMRTIANGKLNQRAFDFVRRNQATPLSATA